MQEKDQSQNSADNNYSFPKKVWITGGIFALIIIILLLIKATFSVFILILAGVIIAVFFRGLSAFINRKTKWNNTICLVISVAGTLLLIAGVFWLIGAKVQDQIAELNNTLPKTIENLKAQLNKNKTGKSIVEYASSPQALQKAKKIAGSFFKTTFGVFGDIYVILFIGIFFTVSPDAYKKGIIMLVPAQGKKKAEYILNKTGDNLKRWLKGKIFAMFVVFVLTAVGLIITGMPLWLVLSLIAGILNFIPNFGPLIAMIPAVLIALMQSPATALIIAGMYILIQVIESNFITPMVQKKLIHIPPALIIIAQLIISPLTGGWGLVLATPLMVIIIVLVQELYIKKQNAEPK